MSSEPILFTGSLNDYSDNDFGRKRRHIFIRKVYMIVFLQLALTALISSIFILNESVKTFVQNSSAALISAFILAIVFLLVIFCCGDIAKQVPANYVILFCFTLCEGYLVGAVTTYYQATSVVLACIITCGITLALTIFAFQTKYDFTGLGPYLLCVFFAVLMFGFLSAIFCSGSSCQTLNLVYALAGALVMSMYIVYDTQLMIGNGHKYSFQEDEYVFAAISLYLDIINLFIYILELIGKRE
jgi:FtsH-binding integral membrane protein